VTIIDIEWKLSSIEMKSKKTKIDEIGVKKWEYYNLDKTIEINSDLDRTQQTITKQFETHLGLAPIMISGHSHTPSQLCTEEAK